MRKAPGLIVTYNPPTEFFENLHILLMQMSPLLVVDNGSSLEIRQQLEGEAKAHPSLCLHFNELNIGIASALNYGFEWAISQGYECLIVFDQDSLPASHMAEELLAVYETHPDREKIAILSPQIQDTLTGERTTYLKKRNAFSMKRIPCQSTILDDVTLVITSGSLNNLAAFEKLGRFRDDFFIDYVDTEYCLRAALHGYKIVVVCKAVLNHRLGGQQQKRIGSFTMRPTFHSPLRWYYIHRNRVVMLGVYAFQSPYWAIHDCMTAMYAFLKMLLYEDQKLKKILATLLGIFDGLFRRMGPISSYAKGWLMEK